MNVIRFTQGNDKGIEIRLTEREAWLLKQFCWTGEDDAEISFELFQALDDLSLAEDGE